MNRQEINIVLRYFQTRNQIRQAGMYEECYLIYLINQEEKIVKNITDKNILSFLGVVVNRLEPKDEEIYDTIVKVLNVFNELGEEKWNINSDQFVKLIKQG